MSKPVLERQSERYSSMGNIAAQGIKKLMGAPNLDRLQTVIREAVQNSWDAAKGRRKPTFLVHLRRLDEDQAEFLRENVFADSLKEDRRDSLDLVLTQDRPWVLELADYGTTGLGGPTDASEVLDSADVSDFVDFIRNIGSPRDTNLGGGTYGYGKSSLFGLSGCNTIVVDSLATYRGKPSRRLIATRIGSSFTISSGSERGKYTGRHWWGHYRRAGDVLDPLMGKQAETASKIVGMPERGEGDYGTSILILDPLFEVEQDKAMLAIQRALLWNFWPKMMHYEGRGSSMHFKTLLSGKEVSLPAPEDCPPLNVFVEAMHQLKSGESDPIQCQRPRAELGRLQVVKEPLMDRLSGFGADDDKMFPERSAHVALMRPAELVVKYLQGSPLPSHMVEWAGVFVCDSEKEIEQAFADSEPPAHDDWNPEFLPKGRGKTFVRTAIRRIREAMESVMASSQEVADGGVAKLAPLSGRLGVLLGSASGDGLNPGRAAARKKGKKSRVAATARLTNVQAWGPDTWSDGSNLAWFTFTIEAPPHSEIRVKGSPKVFIDGDLSEATPDGHRPEVVVWADEKMNVLSEKEVLELTVENSVTVWAGVSIPGEVGVSFHPELEQ